MRMLILKLHGTKGLPEGKSDRVPMPEREIGPKGRRPSLSKMFLKFRSLNIILRFPVAARFSVLIRRLMFYGPWYPSILRIANCPKSKHYSWPQNTSIICLRFWILVSVTKRANVKSNGNVQKIIGKVKFVWV